MTPLVLCPRYEQGEAERGGPGAESRSWQRDSGEQGVGQRPQNRHSAPGPANPRHPPRPPHTSRRNFLAGKGLWERRRWTPAPSPPGNQLEPRVLSRGQGSSGAPPPQKAALLPRPWAPAGRRGGGGTGHTVSLARRAASSSQGPVCPASPGLEAPSDQSPLGTGA